MTDILKRLGGGDRRSIGSANEIVHKIRQNPHLFKKVFNGLYDDDPIIRMRAADVVEKASKNQPELLSGFSAQVISILESATQQEVCWHMAQIAPRLVCTKNQEHKITKILKKYLLHKSKIVRVSAMESLVVFAKRNNSTTEIVKIIKAQIKTGSPAVQSRGRKLLQQIKKNN